MNERTPGLRGALEAVRAAPTLLGGMRLARPLASAARAADDGAAAVVLLAAVTAERTDHLTALAAVHALAAIRHPAADDALTSLLTDDGVPAFVREHATLAFRRRPQHAGALPAVRALAAGGGFPGMLAERTLEAWGARAQRQGESAEGTPSPAAAASAGPVERRGLTVVQLFLFADIDRDLTHAGQGDNGGIATLLVRLGDALVEDGRVARVLTISRGRPTDAFAALEGVNRPGHHVLSVPFHGPVVHASDAWPRWSEARNGIRRILDNAGHIDVLHLRMADVGSMVAAEVACERGIPVVVTVAPDPHALVAARDAAGTLTRATFGPADVAEHLWFRHDLVARLAAQAAHVVLFPRPEVERDARDLLGLEIAADPGRYSVVPEGIDLTVIDRARAEVDAASGAGPVDLPFAGASTPGALAEFDTLLRALPPERRHLPLAITVGRLHRVKGTATLVEAWAAHPDLRERCNLVVVGGDLDDPTDDEQDQLTRIDAVVPRERGPARGLLLAGHRPNGTVAAWLAVARCGRPGLAAPSGAYVCASLKEEFGIAVLEAMACGLVVVAPATGGPPTYVDDGVTGVLADTHDGAALACAVAAALDLAAAPGADERAARAHAMVRERFSIQTMAAALADIYERVVSGGSAPPSPAQEGSPS